MSNQSPVGIGLNMDKLPLSIDDITNPMDISDNDKEEKEMTIFKLNATQLDQLQETTTPLNRPRFQDLRHKYEMCLNQITIYLIEIEKMKKTHNLPISIQEIKEAVEQLKKKEETLEQELNILASKHTDLCKQLPMPTNFGLKNNPSMSDYESVPKFVPNKNNSSFEITWHNLVSAAGSSLSEDGYKQILGCKLFGDSASYYNLYKDRPLKQLVTILANRFCSDKSSDQYIQDIENFKRPDGQSLVQTLECLKYLIMQGYRNKPKEEQQNIMKTTIRRLMPKLVSREVLRKIYEEEKRHDNTSTYFDLENCALTYDDLEKSLPNQTKSPITAGLHQLNAIEPSVKHSNHSKTNNSGKKSSKLKDMEPQKEQTNNQQDQYENWHEYYDNQSKYQELQENRGWHRDYGDPRNYAELHQNGGWHDPYEFNKHYNDNNYQQNYDHQISLEDPYLPPKQPEDYPENGEQYTYLMNSNRISFLIQDSEVSEVLDLHLCVLI